MCIRDSNSGDADAAPGLIEDEPAGTEILADSAYGSGDLRRHIGQREMSAVIKPLPLRPAVKGGYSLDDFDIDEENKTVTCPEGVTVSINAHGRARFAKSCATCPSKKRCTKSKAGRTIVVHDNSAILAAARQLASTAEFQETYRQKRPMIERTIAWLVRGQNRRLRYIGIEKNRIWLAHRARCV